MQNRNRRRGGVEGEVQPLVQQTWGFPRRCRTMHVSFEGRIAQTPSSVAGAPQSGQRGMERCLESWHIGHRNCPICCCYISLVLRMTIEERSQTYHFPAEEPPRRQQMFILGVVGRVGYNRFRVNLLLSISSRGRESSPYAARR